MAERTDAQESTQTPEAQPLLGDAAKPRRRRRSTPDEVLAAAVDTARAGILEITDASTLGEGHEVRGEEDRLSTHLFECTLKGYRGWSWFATLSRTPRSKTATVCEVGLLPGPDALLSPEWVPWSERVRPEELAAQRKADQGTAAQGGAAQDGAESTEQSADEQETPAQDAADGEGSEQGRRTEAGAAEATSQQHSTETQTAGR